MITIQLRATEYKRQKLKIIETPNTVTASGLHFINRLQFSCQDKISFKCKTHLERFVIWVSIFKSEYLLRVENLANDRFRVVFLEHVEFEQTHEKHGERHLVARAVVDTRVVAERLAQVDRHLVDLRVVTQNRFQEAGRIL